MPNPSTPRRDLEGQVVRLECQVAELTARLAETERERRGRHGLGDRG